VNGKKDNTTLEQLSVRALREIIEGIRSLSDEPISKSGKKYELIQRILTSDQKDLAVEIGEERGADPTGALVREGACKISVSGSQVCKYDLNIRERGVMTD